ncbi:hypothetical protein OCOJLMKI_5261 [Methylobacterium iners]|uniref:Uncharacterized protein n=1 Tax=Methylobacterium iners TaxID=418707 RepID=A0ABQ4S8D1_9HYPH|nr:hypothetical protein OCOJLMKI_5261 [Methylobacterium iners]
MVSIMQQYGFRSLYVLAKIGHELRKEFVNTFDEPVQEAFGPLLDALEMEEQVLSLTCDEYAWSGDDKTFQYTPEFRQLARLGS